MSGGVEVAPGHATFGAGGLRGRVDPDAAHPREVDDHPAVIRAEARTAVTAAPDRQGEPVLSRA